MHTFFINDLFQLYCLQHVSNKPSVYPQEDLYIQFYTNYYNYYYYYYLLQLGCYPVAVVILHVYKT